MIGAAMPWRNDRAMTLAPTRALTLPGGVSPPGDPALRSLARPKPEPARPPSPEPPSKSGEVDLASGLRPGARLEGTPYIVVRLLGQGGMGEVYEVEHAALGRHFAVKLLHRSRLCRPDLAVRMREEARTLAALKHPNLIEVFDLGSTSDGRVYFAMELLPGRDLRAELRRLGVLSVPAALGLVAQALDGLGAVHGAGVVHRDIKLENLFLCDDGSLKILDFGIAKRDRRGAPVTGHGMLGTARSMAPEQHASGIVDARTDIYAAGLVLYELVAGRGPFDELKGQDLALRYAHCERRPPPPSTFAPQAIPRPVEEAILKAIAKSPEGRFQSAAEMASVLRDLRAGLSSMKSAPGRSRASLQDAAAILAPAPPWFPLLRDAASALWSRRLEVLPCVEEAIGSARGRIFPLRLKVP
jgi:serine/threonine protein kinase